MAGLKQFGILFSLGSLGIILFVVTSIPTIQQQLATLPATTTAQTPPLWVLLLLQGLQYGVLLAIAVLVGIFCAPSVGLHSHLIDSWIFHKAEPISLVAEVKWSVGLGAAMTAFILVVDRLLQPVLPQGLQVVNPSKLNSLDTLTAVLYGGVTEELLVRWGFMSLLVWLGWKLFKQGIQLPSREIYQGAIVLAAVVFGLLHLPMTATLVPLTHWVILRAILLNGVVGVACGWLFWQYSLEAAMIAHASFHVFVFILNSLYLSSIVY